MGKERRIKLLNEFNMLWIEIEYYRGRSPFILKPLIMKSLIN
jgi:hypothetical protein